jgi:hypothetical protein
MIWRVDMQKKIRQAKWMLRSIRPLVFRPTRTMPQLAMEVTSACQLNCSECSTHVARNRWHGWHASLDQVEALIRATRDSNYWIKELHINGMGEPTLWQHLNEGIKMLAESKCIGRVSMLTNGRSLSRISEESWKHLYHVPVSEYPEQDNSLLHELKQQHGSKINILPLSEFWTLPTHRYCGTTPCVCCSPGPMHLDGFIYLNCGPAGFTAAAQAKDCGCGDGSVECVPCEKGYLETWNPKKAGAMDVCEFCIANCNIPRQKVKHSQTQPTTRRHT